MYTTWFQNPIHLPHGSISINNISKTITHRNSIKFTVIKWQISSITSNPPMREYIFINCKSFPQGMLHHQQQSMNVTSK